VKSLSQASFHVFHPSAKTACYFADTLNFDELGLELIGLAQNGSEARDLVVGHLKSIACAIGLGLGRNFCGGVQLRVTHRINVSLSF
jgi:hypothetical protein